MTGDPIYPGVFVEEQAGVRLVPFLLPGPPLFLGEAAQGPLDRCEEVASLAAFESLYGPAVAGSELAAAVALCLENGGEPALVLRVANATGDGQDGPPQTDDYAAAFDWLERRGPRFGLLALPPGSGPAARPERLYAAARELCRRRRAILLLEPPADWRDAATALAGLPALCTGVVPENAALYLPRLALADGSSVGPAGAVAGAIVRSDRLRGPWKAPAGTEAVLTAVAGVAWAVDPRQQAPLNDQGVNVIRAFAAGPQLWGARTLAGAAALASEWKYLPVRRLALAIEESLEEGLHWVAFEPNGEPLWAAVRPAAGALLHALFRAGAFAGQGEREAWFLRCDASTMTPADVAAGRLNIEVGFAPVRPAEFVVLRIGLWTRDDDD